MPAHQHLTYCVHNSLDVEVMGDILIRGLMDLSFLNDVLLFFEIIFIHHDFELEARRT